MSTRDCLCTVRRGKLRCIADTLIAGLDAEGHRERTKCFCGDEVLFFDFLRGFTILANAVGNPSALLVIVDEVVIRTERVEIQ